MYLTVLVVEHELSCVFKLSGLDLKACSAFLMSSFTTFMAPCKGYCSFFLLNGGNWTKFWIGTIMIKRTPETIVESKK